MTKTKTDTTSLDDALRDGPLSLLSLDFNLEKIIIGEQIKLYAVSFCDTLPGYSSYFASVGGNTVKVYRVLENQTVELIYGFIDEDLEEVFYCCTWCATADGKYDASLICCFLLFKTKFSAHGLSKLQRDCSSSIDNEIRAPK